MNDILPDQTPLWRYFEGTVSRLLDNYGYRQIRMPIVEFTELFKRSIGEVTDIVEKEMYTFADRNGDSLTLRPEGTAACVRAVLEHGITGGGQVQKLCALSTQLVGDPFENGLAVVIQTTNQFRVDHVRNAGRVETRLEAFEVNP
nr:hypothetical protein [Tanacetum cinerariifolium]